MSGGDVSRNGERLGDELAIDLKQGHLAERSLCKGSKISDCKTTNYKPQRSKINPLTLLELGPVLAGHGDVLELDLGKSEDLAGDLNIWK